jgi:CRP-like cAMP-binding protein
MAKQAVACKHCHMKDFLKNIGELSEKEVDEFLSFGRLCRYQANEVVFSGGRPFTKLLFIETGLIRAYRIIDGNDFSYFFFSNNEFAVDFQSYLTETVSSLLFETLTETTYYEYTKSVINTFYTRMPKLERIGRLMAEKAYLSAAERLKQHQTDSLKSRYLTLISKNPQLFQEVSLRHIASYLGVKPQSLSRIRAEIAGKHY